MGKEHLVVVGASAGGIEPLKDVLAGLPADLAANVLVVVHLAADNETRLPQILNRVAGLRVKLAEDGEPLQPGSALLAPPGRHLMVTGGTTSLSFGPRENGFRPAVDVLFRSAAVAYGSRVIGVVLSGAGDDGAAGMVAIRLRGGIGIVQEPGEALHPSMPQAAIEAARLDDVVPSAKIADLVLELIDRRQTPTDPDSVSELMATEMSMAAQEANGADLPEHRSEPSAFVCPDCSGPLYEIGEGELTRYRCRVGHGWSPLSLAEQQSAKAENALWTAAETLEEKAALRERLGRQAREAGSHVTAQRFERTAEAAREDARQIRRLLRDTSGEADADL